MLISLHVIPGIAEWSRLETPALPSEVTSPKSVKNSAQSHAALASALSRAAPRTVEAGNRVDWYVIQPQTTWRMLWDMVGLGFILYIAINVPPRTAPKTFWGMDVLE